MAKRSIAEQLIAFIREHESKVNLEAFSTIEFIVQHGKLDGMRIKEYVKNMKKDE